MKLLLPMTVLLLSLLALVAGCGPAETEKPGEPELLKPHTDALNRAREVEGELDEAARRQREQIDDQH